VNGVKVGHLIAEPVAARVRAGARRRVLGLQRQHAGPTIEAVEGDRVRIYVTNRLPEPTTVHWHGIILPNGMDGVAGLTQRPIPPARRSSVRVHAHATRARSCTTRTSTR
jgi:FtsP/CotA-like multicopper oxidase with cupredoxin domain